MYHKSTRMRVLSLFILSIGQCKVGLAQSIKAGEADITPAVELTYVTNSNTYLSSSDEVSSNGVRVSPTISLLADKRLLRIEFGYEGDFASMSEDVLNFDDHKIYAKANAEINSRNRLSLSADIIKEHEEFGTGRTFGEVAGSGEAVEYVDSKIDGNYTFGAISAKGNVGVGLLIRNLAYQNRADLTTGTDNLELTPYGRFSYRL